MSEVQQLKDEIERLRNENMYKQKQFEEMRYRMEHDRECSLKKMEYEREEMECRCREMECRCDEMRCRYEQEIKKRDCKINDLLCQVSELKNRLRH